LNYLRARAIETPEDREAIAAVSAAQCNALGKEIAGWALGILGTKEVYDVELICRFFDSLLYEIRQRAWEWLTPECPGYGDPVLWSRLVETPYDDIRLRLVDLLEKRTRLPGADADLLTSIWCSVLLAVHRGNRQKRKAIRQVGEAIQRDPSRADQLLPVLAVAIRSVRPSEAGPGLAAIAAALEARPELAPVVQRSFPELRLPPVEAAP
jgi:hypothetical protein